MSTLCRQEFKMEIYRVAFLFDIGKVPMQGKLIAVAYTLRTY